MLNKGFLLLASLLICLQVQAHPGFRQIALTDRQGEPINVAVWYPAHVGGVTEKVGENAAFVGVSVIPSAPPIQGEHPLLVISHGYNGNWRNLSWIAAAMAMQGYIVAAPDHPGTTTFNQNPADAKQLWRRPQDISQVIDSVISSPGLFGTTDKSRIAALGHSLGGWTVMALAGARFDPVRFSHDCQQRLQRGDCQLEQKFGLDHDALQEKRFTESRDSRIKAVVALDSGLAPGFTPQSLRDISIPVLILAARSDKLAELPS